jgi:protein tyrosine phosphatase (PTP) superfamily phosphohydrolase (DUF442 family)
MAPHFRARAPRAFVAVSLILGVLALLSAWPIWLRWSGNVHVVEPGVLLRSGQLGPDALTALIHDQSIRTVINLRGAHPEQPWYRKEVAAAQAAGATLVDLKLSATRLPSDEETKALTTTLADARPPILIHCEGGADRTGLASALYLALVRHRPIAEARNQLSAWFGHLPVFANRTAAMDEAFARIAASGHGTAVASKPPGEP